MTAVCSWSGERRGLTSTDAVATATVFDPATGHWSAVTDMLQPRAYPMAVTLADGSVLVAGGSRNTQPLDTAERYNPDNGTWVAAGRLNLPRAHETLTLLNDGRVLAAGGGIEGGPGWASTPRPRSTIQRTASGRSCRPCRWRESTTRRRCFRMGRS